MRARSIALFVITLAFLVLAMRGLDPAAALAALADFEVWRLPLVALCYGLVLLVRTERFRRLLPSSPTFGPLLAVMSASFLAINVMPLRMGELVRPYLLSRRAVPLAESVTAVLVERVLDMVALLALVAVAVNVAPSPALVVEGVDLITLGRRTVTVSVVLIVAALFALRLFGNRWRSPQGSPPSRLRDLATKVDDAFRGLRSRTLADRAIVLACTLLSWCGSTAACGLAMGGFADLRTTLSSVLFEWAATMCAVVLLPTPGFVGGFEAGAVGGLVALGDDADTARAFALVLHATQFLFTCLAGVIGFVALGMTLRATVAASRERP